jgi:hypothetical protein
MARTVLRTPQSVAALLSHRGLLMRRPKMAELSFVALIVVGIGWFYHVPAMYAWMRHTGSVAPHGLTRGSFQGKPGSMITVVGHTPRAYDTTREPPFVGAYHVLVMFSADSLTTREEDWSVTTGPVRQDINEAWDVWSNGRAVRHDLSTHYDGFLRIARIGERQYSLKRGNLFVVRYDSQDRMSVQQLSHTYRADDTGEALTTIQRLLPGDAAVQDLTHFDLPGKPCPHRQAAPAARGATT